MEARRRGLLKTDEILVLHEGEDDAKTNAGSPM
jgi:hypothetical protein